MARFEKGFHPLKDIESQGTPRVNFDLGLPPYVKSEQIGINVRRLEGMMDMGGIRHLRVNGVSGEVTKYRPKAVGFTNDGTAFAAAEAEGTQVRPYEFETDSQSEYHFTQAANWQDVTLKINLDETQNRIQEAGEPVRSVSAWTQELDDSVKRGVVDAGIQNVVKDAKIHEQIVFAVAPISGTLAGIEAEPEELLANPTATAIGITLLVYGIGNTINAICERGMGKDESMGTRFSLFNGPQLDRAAILWGMSKTGNVVKPIDTP